jgi:xanthine dehydrogenase accessory factor
MTFAVVTLLNENGTQQKALYAEDEAQSQGLWGGLAQGVLDRVASMARAAISSGRPTILDRITEGDQKYTVTIEVIRPKPSVVVFGAGHVGQAVALMSSLIGYAVTAVDDREAFANRNRLPDPSITLVAEPFDRAAKAVQITSNTAVVIVTRGHQYDELCLRSVIESRARYIGMIGSRRRVISVFKQLTQSGVDGKLLDRVHAPIGLAINARSPQEIAVAILGEIIQTFNAQVAETPSAE